VCALDISSDSESPVQGDNGREIRPESPLVPLGRLDVVPLALGGDRKRPRFRPLDNASFPHALPLDRGVERALREILDHNLLTAVFQPVADLSDAAIFGYHAAIRGPSDSPLHVPANLFAAAEAFGLRPSLEKCCRQVILDSFSRLRLNGKLFLPVDMPAGNAAMSYRDNLAAEAGMAGVAFTRVVVRVAPRQPVFCDGAWLRRIVSYYHARGFKVCLEGLGSGGNWLHLWPEFEADYAAIDGHFIEDILRDPLKQHYLSRLLDIVSRTGSMAIAEGVETTDTLALLKKMGTPLGRGAVIGLTRGHPAVALPVEVIKTLDPAAWKNASGERRVMARTTAEALLIDVSPVAPGQTVEEVFGLFTANPSFVAIPVVKDGNPVGLINRYLLIDRYARPFRRELYGRKWCTHFMDPVPLIVDKSISVEELSRLVVESEQRYLWDGFIITDRGSYIGMGTGHALVREMTQLKVQAARYSNPLTLLPGNVPINDHIDNLLRSGVTFVAAYCDLNNFKPFNDVYGYNKGDDIIQLTAGVLTACVDGDKDFVGHVGGDDFVVLFQSTDWESRCLTVLDKMESGLGHFFRAEDVQQGGYLAEDRQGRRIFNALPSLGIGAVTIDPALFPSHREVAAYASTAKKQAKRQSGNCLFIERREYSPQKAVT